MKAFRQQFIAIICVLFFALSTSQANTRSSAHPPKQAAVTPLPETAEAKRNRKQAYLRYIEAQRMKASRTTKPSDLVTIYKEIIQLDPAAADPHADLAEVYLRSGQMEAAEREAKEAIRLDRDCLSGHKVLSLLYVILVRYDKNVRPTQIDRAIQSYEEVARIDPTNGEAWAFLADLYQMKNDPVRQTRALERLTALGSIVDTGFYRSVMNAEASPDRSWYQLSQLYLAQNKPSQAIEAARRAFEADPDSALNARNLMNMLRLSSSGEEELQMYYRLLKRHDAPVLQIGYSAALVRVGRYNEAINKLRELQKSDPQNAGVIELLAVAQRRSGKRLEAVETLKQAIAKLEPSARQKLNLELGETYEELGRSADAVAYYEGVFNELANRSKLDAASTETLTTVVARLTRAYNRQGDKKKAQAVFARAQQLLGENNPMVNSLLIDELREEGKYREALEATRAALSRYPNDRSLKLTEAMVLGELRNYEESLSALRAMLKEQSVGDTTLLAIMSNVQMQGGQFQEAETTIRKALEIDPNDMDLLIQLGAIQDRLGQRAEAEKTLRTVLQREPDNATALNNLGYFLAERSARYNEALPLIEKAVSIEPMNGSFLDSLGWVQYKMGRLQEARGHLEKATVYARRNAAAYEHLGDVLRDLGRVQEARRNWEVALEYSVEAGVITRLKDKIKNTQQQ
ncbi:MAG TPA: tetratricopeptide repeat protein [Blastocatellia bacterium]|nr:tetratricopeptide repeat protein [Blastocatellia bacterium]